jgi:GNAT superfamily N-acetyltransferase
MTDMPTTQARTRIEALDAAAYAAAIPELADLLLDSVASGASVNFLSGVTRQAAVEWWSARQPQVGDGTITPFIARWATQEAGVPRLVGCTLLIRSRNQNAPHRAEIAKVLVHTSARRDGIGRALMEAAEARAADEGRWLLHLDTETGSAAEALYRALGWHELGIMPNHSLRTDGVPAATTFFWKDLRA